MYTKKMLLLAFLVVCLMATSVIVAAPDDPQGGTFAIPWWTVDGGGSSGSVGGSYTLGGTIGQADTTTSGSGVYTLVGGFWNPTVLPAYAGKLYLPNLLK